MSIREKAITRRKQSILTYSLLCISVYFLFVYSPIKSVLCLNSFERTKVAIDAFQTDNFESIKFTPGYFYSNELPKIKILVKKKQLTKIKKSDIIGSSSYVWHSSQVNKGYFAANINKSDIYKYEIKWISFYTVYLSIMLLLFWYLAKTPVKF